MLQFTQISLQNNRNKSKEHERMATCRLPYNLVVLKFLAIPRVESSDEV